MKTDSSVAGVFMASETTNLARALSQLQTESTLAEQEAQRAWQIFCGGAYSEERAARYRECVSESLSAAERLIEFKQEHGI